MIKLSLPPLRPLARRVFPFLAWIGELKSKDVLQSDAIAGITVALILIPQSMAYAQLAGLPSYYGLYAAFLPPMVGALFGSSRQLGTGPTAISSLLTAAALAPLATVGSAGYIAYAITLAILAGVFQLALGMFRLGVIVNFLSQPVVVGFTNGAAIIIATSQIDKIFGVSAAQSAHHYETVWNTLLAITQYFHWPTLIIAIVAFSLMIGLRKINPRIPNILVAVAVTTLVSYFIGFEKAQTARVDGFGNEIVREVLRDQLDADKDVRRLDAELERAQERLKAAITRAGNDAIGVRLLNRVNALKLQRNRRAKDANVGVEQLKTLRFDFAPAASPAQSMFYLHRETPPGMEIDGNLWRIVRVEADGNVVMDGGGQVVGKIPQGLPVMSVPKFDFSALVQLFAAAITVVLIGFMEAVSIAKAMAAKTRSRFDPNQELIGQGLAKIVGGLFQSYPGSGSFSRSAVNFSAGAITGFSSVVTSLIVVATLLWFTPLLYHLPQATLAAVIMMAVLGLINIKAIKHAWDAHKHDGVVALTSFGLTLAFAPHLDKGILIAAGLALVLYLYRSMQPRVAVLARHPDGTLRDANLYRLDLCANIAMIRFDGSLFFANTSYFEDNMLERVATKPHLKYIIVVGDGINEIDATGEDMLAALTQRLREGGIEVLFTGLKRQVLDLMGRTGLSDKLGAAHFFRTEEQALHYAWKQLGHDHEVDCPLNIVCSLTPDK